MSKMINIKGREISEETVIEALKKHCNFEEKFKEKYIFQAGDIAVNCNKEKRIIVGTCGRLVSIDANGNEQSKSQQSFESWGYEKIGKLKDLLEKI